MWNRRELLGVLGTGAAGLALLTNRSEAGDDQVAPAAGDQHGHHGQHSAMMKDCAEACRRCAEHCGHSASDEVMKNCVAACKKCEESCRKMVAAMGGDHHHQNPAIRGQAPRG